MALDEVQPGDLIRADQMNEIVHALEGLEVRVSNLENQTGGPTAPGAVRITDVLPDTPRIGDTVQILGENFDYATGAARVQVGEVLIGSFDDGSSDNLLIFELPTIPNVPPNGTRAVTLKVSNFDTSDEQPLVVRAEASVFQGNIDLNFSEARPSPIEAGDPLELHYHAHSDGQLPVTLTVTPTVSTGWSGTAVLEDTNGDPGDPLPSRRFTLPAFGDFDFWVRVPVPAGTGGDEFTVTVTIAGQGVTGASDQRTMTVGQDAPENDPHIRPEVDGVEGASLVGSILRVPGGTEGLLGLTFGFDQVGDYDVRVALDPPSSPGWSVATDAPVPTTGKPSFTIDQSDLDNTPNGWATRPVLVSVSPTSAAASTTLRVAGRRHGAEVTSELTFQVQVGS